MRHTRQVLWRAWDAHGWAALLVAVLVVTAAGVVGFSSYDASQSLSNRLYLTVQLFTLNSGGLDGDVPWLLELARWVAPVVTALAAAEAVIRILRSRSAGWRARLLKGHLVVVGLGDRGWRVVQRAVEDQIPVAAVEVDPANPRVNSARRLGVPVVLGDAGELDRLLAAGLRGADRLVCFAGHAATNAAVAQTLFEARRLCRATFTSFVEIPDAAVMRELQGLLDEGWAGPRQEFFNLEDRAGAVILGRHDPLEFGVLPRARPVVVVGSGDAGLSVLGAAANRWEAAVRDGDDASVLELRLLVPHDEDVALASRRVSVLHPDFSRSDDDTVPHSSMLRVDPLDAWRPGPALEATLATLPEEPALVVVATTDEAVTLRVTAAWVRLLAGTSVPVVVVAPDRTGPVSLLARPQALPGPGPTAPRKAEVHLFAVNHELCSDELIRRGRIDALARAIHDGYVRHLSASGAAAARTVENPAHVSWEVLSPTLRQQNVSAARAMWEMLHAEGFAVVARDSLASASRVLPDEVVDRMAAREHQRWFADKYPDRPRPDWADLEPRHREQSRDQVRRFPATLAAAGLQLAEPQQEPTPASRGDR